MMENHKTYKSSASPLCCHILIEIIFLTQDKLESVLTIKLCSEKLEVSVSVRRGEATKPPTEKKTTNQTIKTNYLGKHIETELKNELNSSISCKNQKNGTKFFVRKFLQEKIVANHP